MDEKSIEILGKESVAASKAAAALPMNFVSVGTVEVDSLRVYIRQSVYKRLEKFARENMSKEVGSILVGDFVEENGKKTVIISDYIEAKYTDSTASTLTFTHETWNYVNKEKDTRYPDKKIVGWQHTHPGYGIFLSNYDLFIQENFFNLPWQTAYVIDPIAGTRGFFQWRNEKVEKMTGFFVYDEVGEKLDLREKAKREKASFPIVQFVLAAFLAVSLLFGATLAVENRQLETTLEAALEQLSSTPVQDEAVISQQSEEGIERFRVYIVEKGDCLEDIIEKHRLDYRECITTVRKINSITDVNKIYAGQKLYLPIETE